MPLVPSKSSRARPSDWNRRQDRSRRAMDPLKSQTRDRSSYAATEGVGLVTTRRLDEQLERQRLGQNQLDYAAPKFGDL